ncbi:hypothetical protein HNP48_002268 [Acidovorax soli]|uniref:Uncharacterized protein n=1 Tax=Acidovorax soli TaxID=592050 RepID=A0A7X0PD36_9BURK|nr:hypothetical protein [Acidovorax soli]MBB6559601.1 hypothetical protein [Acidovorax soli]
MNQALTTTYERVSQFMRAASLDALRTLLAEDSDGEIAIELENSWPATEDRPARAEIAAAVALVRGEVEAAALADARNVVESLRSQATREVYEVADDSRYFASSRIKDFSIRLRILVERAVIRRAVTDILSVVCEEGPAYTISVDDGEDIPLAHSRDVNAIMDEVCACDEERLVVRRVPAEGSDRRQLFGSIYLVYGNDGWDVMCDYHVSLEEVLAGANRFADDISNVL